MGNKHSRYGSSCAEAKDTTVTRTFLNSSQENFKACDIVRHEEFLQQRNAKADDKLLAPIDMGLEDEECQVTAKEIKELTFEDQATEEAITTRAAEALSILVVKHINKELKRRIFKCQYFEIRTLLDLDFSEPRAFIWPRRFEQNDVLTAAMRKMLTQHYEKMGFKVQLLGCYCCTSHPRTVRTIPGPGKKLHEYTSARDLILNNISFSYDLAV